MGRSIDYEGALAVLEPLALEAGKKVLSIFEEGCDVLTKADASPVTRADHDAEAIVVAGLQRLYPHVPVVAEEAVAAGILPGRLGEAFFLVDPLDGTREFVNRSHDFTVNIALVVRAEPVLGLVSPVHNTLYLGRPGVCEAVRTDADHRPVSRRAMRTRVPGHTPIIVASRSHRTIETDSWLARLPQSEILSVGSSLKFCMIAAGNADYYPRFGPTMQWDTAAGDAVLRAAGGRTRTLDGVPLIYGCADCPTPQAFANPNFIADCGVDIVLDV